MNPKLMALMQSRRKAKAAPPMGAEVESPAEATTDNPMEEAAEGPDYHHEQVRRHLDKGINGSRRGAKIHLKLAKHHHDMATGRKGKK